MYSVKKGFLKDFFEQRLRYYDVPLVHVADLFEIELRRIVLCDKRQYYMYTICCKANFPSENLTSFSTFKKLLGLPPDRKCFWKFKIFSSNVVLVEIVLRSHRVSPLAKRWLTIHITLRTVD